MFVAGCDHNMVVISCEIENVQRRVVCCDVAISVRCDLIIILSDACSFFESRVDMDGAIVGTTGQTRSDCHGQSLDSALKRPFPTNNSERMGTLSDRK